jgi:hypothetical protein
MAGDFEPKLGDPAENHKNISRNARKLHGAPVERWIELIKQNPERTLPGGVAGAIVAHYERVPEHTTMVPVSTEILPKLREWSDPVHVMVAWKNGHVASLHFKRHNCP